MDDALAPSNRDGFEAGDHRNFAPVYLGDGDGWIRPRATVTDEDPIAGDYSLRWSAGEDSHRWALLSNAFYLRPPVEASARVRIDGPGEAAVGLALAESSERAAALEAGDGVELTAASWDEAAAEADATLDRGAVYDLSLALDGSALAGDVTRDGETVAELEAETTVEPNALALVFDTAGGADASITVDDVRVDAAPYRVPADEWVRSPRFVVLPRRPDVGLDQGNWVGAASVIDEGDRRRMWYRIRTNEARGAGYGLAESADGVTWEKYEENPVFVPDRDSNEGISVLREDGGYRAWYTIDDGDDWHVAHAESPDGIEWALDGVVVEGYCKDPVVLRVDGTYYLYAIAPTNTDLSVYTSVDGHDWERENTIELDVHSHPGAYYLDDAGTFHLYAFAEEGSSGAPASVRRAASDDGINFGALEPTWTDPPVGLDDRPTGGIDYGDFPTDGDGHLPDERRLLMYYQARHNYENNRPGWRLAGDGRVVLGGRFTGLFEGVPTTVEGDAYAYHGFPATAAPVEGLSLAADSPVTATVERWAPGEAMVLEGRVEAEEAADLRLAATALSPDATYSLLVDGEAVAETTADGTGAATFEATFPDGTATIAIERAG